MHPPPAESWPELHRCESLREARSIITSIAAMEFEVRLRDAASNRLIEPDDPELEAAGPFVIEVRRQHLEDLSDVLDQIVDEQQEFDRFVDDWHSITDRRLVLLFILAACVIVLLAILTVLEL